MKDLIIIAAEEFIDKFNKLNDAVNTKTIPYIPHKFDLTGHCAGQFKFRKSDCLFRWNLELAEQNSGDYLINTVGHEVAHLIAYTIDKHSKAHGNRWKSIMYHLGLEPTRCHNYASKPARTVKRPYTYICLCGKKHSFTITKFKNIVLSGITSNGTSNYHCNTCKTPINIKNISVQEIKQ